MLSHHDSNTLQVMQKLFGMLEPPQPWVATRGHADRKNCLLPGALYSLTVCLHGCSPLHQVVSELHGIRGAKRKVPRQTDHKDPHQCVFKDGHLGAEAKEEAA